MTTCNVIACVCACLAVAGCDRTANEQPAHAVATATGASRCEDLAGLSLPDTKITLAALVAAGGFVPPAPAPLPPGVPQPTYDRVPAFCRVAATIAPTPDSAIKIEVWLPADGWNGKLVGTGNGGFSGAIGYDSLGRLVERRYAAVSTNTGHDGGAADASFAVGHPEKLVDFGWRAVHEMTVKAKAIVAARYGTPANRAYWSGCSSGGRQGLKEAQQFPEDYDAIAAGAPANNWIPLMAQAALMQQLLTDPVGGLPPPKLALLKEAAIAACDARDGVTDRVINEPRTCPFEPAALQCAAGDGADCLTAAQVETARKIHHGVANPRTGATMFPGQEPASEPEWFAFTPGVFPIGESYFRDLVIGDPSWQLAALDYDADVARARELDTVGFTTTEPDLEQFVGRGGKLLLWHGETDGLISTQNTIDYFNSVVATTGADATKDSVRLFLVPGMNHCSGGEGTFVLDDVGTLDAWVEQKRAPDQIIASRPLAGGAQRTRPLCAYPQVAHYKGTGSTDDAANFECGAPTPQ